MKKILDYVKKNVLFSILIILFVLIVILGLVAIKSLIFPSYKQSKYGNRLDGINNVGIVDSRVDEVLSLVETSDQISYKSYRVSGRIVNIYFDVTDDITDDSIKSYANSFVNSFSDDELSFYDFQVFINKSDESCLIGYKNKKSLELVWNYVGEN